MEALSLHLVKSGIRQIEHPTEFEPELSSNHNTVNNNSIINNNRIRKPISLSNGFRKHVISTFIEAGLNHEIRELLVDHASQLDQYYFRPSQEQVLNEYLKAEPLLTIDLSLRLQHENKSLREENREIQRALSRIDRLYQELGLET